jgi:hypothetical protein
MAQEARLLLVVTTSASVMLQVLTVQVSQLAVKIYLLGTVLRPPLLVMAIQLLLEMQAHLRVKVLAQLLFKALVIKVTTHQLGQPLLISV